MLDEEPTPPPEKFGADPNVWSVAYCEKHQPISARLKHVRRIVRQLTVPKETHG